MSTQPLITPTADMEYQTGSIVSRTIIDRKAGTVTLFAFDAGQKLSEHSTPYDALVHIVDGEAVITIGGTPQTVAAGSMLIMPADVPHAVAAEKRFKMVLTMVREKGKPTPTLT